MFEALGVSVYVFYKLMCFNECWASVPAELQLNCQMLKISITTIIFYFNNRNNNNNKLLKRKLNAKNIS